MPRILFYTDTPLLGGAENQMYTLAKFLPDEKFQITLACSSFQKLNPWCQKFLQLGKNILRLKVLHKNDPRHFLFLKKILKDFDLLHLHLWNPASCRYAILAASKIPIIITEHDPFPLQGLKKWLKEKLMKRVKKIIVASEYAKKRVLDGIPGLEKKITVIQHGIDIEEFREFSVLENRNEYRRIHFRALPNEKVILCVAELHERKGQKYLIEAFKRVIENFPNTKLVLIGEGPKRKHYEKLAHTLGDKILFLGHRKEIAKFMAAADIFVLPSVREAFGLVLLEAAVVGTPIVATNVGGIPEIVEHGKTGLLVAPENSKALADALATLLKNTSKAIAFSEAAREKIEMKFHAKMMAEKTAAVYESI